MENVKNYIWIDEQSTSQLKIKNKILHVYLYKVILKIKGENNLLLFLIYIIN